VRTPHTLVRRAFGGARIACAAVVPKKIAPKATRRTALRRKIYDALSPLIAARAVPNGAYIVTLTRSLPRDARCLSDEISAACAV
jgi:RNase P protein component